MSEGSHLFVQGEKVSYCKTYETHLHSTHKPPSFPTAVVGVFVPQNVL